MSVENLAARLDALDAEGAFISESAAIVSISKLNVKNSREVGELAFALGWETRFFDSAGNLWEVDDLDELFAPFRIEIEKPAASEGVLRLLTNVGFAQWLDRDESSVHWQVARLTIKIEAHGAYFTAWHDEAAEFVADCTLRSPRTLVREFSSDRHVPASLSRWLLRDVDTVSFHDTASEVWADHALRMLLLSLPDEFDCDNNILRFKGPPRLDLGYPDSTASVLKMIGLQGFKDLQAASAWVFEIERESEMRHILLATELARCGGASGEVSHFLRNYVGAALEGAKTAYQVQLAGMSSDALKSLTELRKSVSDDTAKISDATRQITTAVASAVAIGIGLIVARLTTQASPLLIKLVLGMAIIHVLITIVSGWMFTRLQRKVREEWKPRLYRFLSQPDYEALVSGPALKAEKYLRWCSCFGMLAIAVMAIALFRVSPTESRHEASRPTEEKSIVVPIKMNLFRR